MQLARCLLLLVMFCSTLFAAENAAVGKWDCVSDDGHGSIIRWNLVINSADGKLSGSITSPDLNLPLIDPKLEFDALTFGAFVNPECTLLFKLNIDANKLAGSFSCPQVIGTLKGTRLN